MFFVFRAACFSQSRKERGSIGQSKNMRTPRVPRCHFSGFVSPHWYQVAQQRFRSHGKPDNRRLLIATEALSAANRTVGWGAAQLRVERAWPCHHWCRLYACCNVCIRPFPCTIPGRGCWWSVGSRWFPRSLMSMNAIAPKKTPSGRECIFRMWRNLKERPV